MKTNHQNDALSALNVRLRALPVRDKIRLPDAGDRLREGQLWSVAAGSGLTAGQSEAAPTFSLFLTERVDAKRYNAVPVFRWGELAGPDCVYIPAELAGCTLVAALDLEATVERTGLCACPGRLPDKAVQFVLDARSALYQPENRAGFTWGLGFSGPCDHRLAFFEHIAKCLEALQAPIREHVFVAPVSKIDMDWSEISTIFRHLLPQVPSLAAADDGSACTPCVLVDAKTSSSDAAGEQSVPTANADVLNFDEILPGDDREICCEWRLSAFSGASLAAEALVVEARSELPIGKASVHAGPDGWLIVLTQNELPASADPVRDPSMLRILLVESS